MIPRRELLRVRGAHALHEQLADAAALAGVHDARAVGGPRGELLDALGCGELGEAERRQLGRGRRAARAYEQERAARDEHDEDSRGDPPRRAARRAPVRPARGDELLQLEPRVADVVQPVVRLLAEAARDQPLQRVGGAARQRDQSGSRVRITSARSRRARTGEGCTPGEHLVQQTAERPDVGAPVDGSPRGCSGLM